MSTPPSRWNPLPSCRPTDLVPLFYAALLFLAGIVSARYLYLRPSLLLAALVPLTALACLAILRAPRLSLLPIAFVWLILGFWSAETEPQPSPSPAITPLADGLLRTVEATVVEAGPPRAPNPENATASDTTTEAGDFDPNSSPTPGSQLQRVDLQLTAAEVVTDSSDEISPIRDPRAKVRLTIHWPPGAVLPIRCGQRLRAVLRMLPPDTYHDPGLWSRAEWLESQSIAAVATLVTGNANDPDHLAILAQPATPLPCLLSNARQAAAGRLESLPALTRRLPDFLRVNPGDAAMLTALIAGDRTFLTRSLRSGFERTGSFHLIVVSGLHLAILAGCVFALARRLRLPRLAATALTLAITLGYALFTGFAIPAQRSFWMIALYLLGRLLYRNRNPLNIIGFAAICLMAASPRSIFEASLQMTLLAVASIAGIALPLLDRTIRPWREATHDLNLTALDPKLPPHLAQFRVTLRMTIAHLASATSPPIARLTPPLIRSTLRAAELLFVALIVELALALPIATYFHRITLYALPANLLLLPALAVLVPAAMILLLALAIWPAAAVVPAAVCAAILHLSLWFLRILGALALGNLRVPAPSALQTAIAVSLVLLAIQLARGGKTQHRLAFPAVVLAATAALLPRPIDHPAGALLFEAIDVGQGDSLLLISPDGKTLLIDAGGIGFLPNSAPGNFDIGEEVVSAVLWSRGIRQLDAVALTHAHQDHMGGLTAVLRNFHPREFWVGANPPIPAYTALLAQAQVAGARIRALRAGDTLALGQASFRVLAPKPGYRPHEEPTNNDSLVLEASYAANSILLAGDAEAPEENDILAGNGPGTAPETSLRSTVLKVGHHGSLTSTRPAFLAQVSPEWAVISCGRRNRFHHPRPEILAELQAAHAITFRTDLDGATCLLLDGQSVTAQPMCQGPAMKIP